MKYRNDIDGLRAIAVLSVVLFHGNIGPLKSLVQGGFAGVDVFFVISGFLISKTIYSNFTAGTYNIADFYARRVRRIMPAIMVVYLFCIVASIFLSMGDEAEEIRKSVLSSLFFVSNFFFASKAGYFEPTLTHNPLLHTWSLSVEEQFYIIFPLFLFLIRKLDHRPRVLCLAAAALASLGWSEYVVLTAPSNAYYDPFSRAWELLTGSLLAITTLPKLSRRNAEIMGAVGLAAILGAIRFYGRNVPFPGLTALLPCLGTAAVLWSGAHYTTAVSRVLTLAPMRFTGLISYSLYLWHWPLIVFTKTSFHLSMPEKAGLGVMCYVVAALSWRFVEQPFRKISVSGNPVPMLRGGAVATVCVAAVSFLTTPLNAIIWPQTPAIRRLVALNNFDPTDYMRDGTCFSTPNGYNTHYNREKCLALSTTKPNVLLLGDSHSAQYWQALHTQYPEINFLQASASGCLPIQHTLGEEHCTRLRDYIFDDFLPHHHVDAIVLAAYYLPPTEQTVQDALKTAQALTAYTNHIYILGPNPTLDTSLPRLLIRAEYKGQGIVAEHFDNDMPTEDRLFRNTPMPPNVSYLSYYATRCPGSTCSWFTSTGEPLLFDNNHLTPSGSADIIRAWAGQLPWKAATP